MADDGQLTLCRASGTFFKARFAGHWTQTANGVESKKIDPPDEKEIRELRREDQASDA